jgi:alpha-1,2-mannosyltransferase
MIKPQLGLFVLWAALRRKTALLGAFVLVLGLGAAATALWLGLTPFVGYLDVLRYIAQRGETFYPNQSVNGFMNRLVENGSSVDFGDSMPEPNSIVAMTTGLSSLLFLALALIPARRRVADAQDFALMGLVATLASPIAWEHHYGLLLPAFALLARSWLEGGLRGSRLWLTAAAWTLTANSWEAANAFAGTPLRFLQSTLLAGVLGLALTLRLPGEGDSQGAGS